ncbi:MAG: hypothetical protein CMI36_00365 [Owenweeksia sp.]|nr:hypothetical protein [Owenweeksia sp.]MBF97418.1 hypothetical protein [Owenweeksia sp.]HBF20743.1 hypothetical protein [Cryomorphaceae bacterium]|tara:strand:+ start:739 stop:1341 length:603 start_codon:yes stop_codon:yes gene_type:complete
MNITTAVVLRHFLLKLRTQLDDPTVTSIDPFFQTFFTKGELEDIVHTLYDSHTLNELDPDGMSKEELLDTIADDAIILGYFIDRWEDERYAYIALTEKGVKDILTQLELQTHYLWYKPIPDWDAYDLGNYRELQVKAGKVAWVYGIYDASITEENMESVTAPPIRFYDSQELAASATHELVQSGQFHDSELHILPVLAGQ